MTGISPTEPGVKGTVTTVELSRQERAVARRSAETRAIVPSVELTCQVEIDRCLDLAREQGARPLSVVLAILARALREFPRLNGAYRDGRYELYSRVNLAVSLPGPDEPVTATLFDAAERPVSELDADLIDLSRRGVEGRLSAAELSGATFTVTPPGPEGVSLLTPLVQPPQAAALAVGAFLESAVIRHGVPAAGRVSQCTLACDHRIVHAHLAAEFLARLKRSLEAPAL